MKIKTLKYIVPVIFILIFAQEAYVTRIYHKKVSLNELTEYSDCILVVKKISPITSYEKISILPEGSSFAGKNDPPYYTPLYHVGDDYTIHDKNFPPYTKIYYHFEILEVLYSSEVISKKSIKVEEASSNSKLRMFKNYYLKGLRKSPIVETYDSSLDMDETKEKFIVFLTKRDNPVKLSFTMRGAYEKYSFKRKILGLIKKAKS